VSLLSNWNRRPLFQTPGKMQTLHLILSMKADTLQQTLANKVGKEGERSILLKNNVMCNMGA
jgi:hypothetical protein